MAAVDRPGTSQPTQHIEALGNHRICGVQNVASVVAYKQIRGLLTESHHHPHKVWSAYNSKNYPNHKWVRPRMV